MVSYLYVEGFADYLLELNLVNLGRHLLSHRERTIGKVGRGRKFQYYAIAGLEIRRP
jgi:hypothetical protein